MPPRLAPPVLFAALALAAAPAGAQLSLGDALREADHAAFANREATSAAAARRALRLAPLSGIAPSLRVEAGYARTTDPIGAFGTTLRQRAVTPAAFDPRQLNFPDAAGNYQAGLVAEVPLLNADAWAGRRATARAAAAGDDARDWTRLTTRADVVRAFYGAVLANERVTTLEVAGRAAHAHVDQAQSMVRNGVVTRADALLASVRAADVDAQLLEARGAATIARRQLALLLGRTLEEVPLVPSALPTSAAIRELVSPDTLEHEAGLRRDVAAASNGAAAADADAMRARATLLPRLNAVARYDWNSPTQPWGGDRNWTVGVMATWSVFGGARELADVQSADARREQARVGLDAARAEARLQVAQSATALSVAFARLTIAEQSVTQADEAHRLVERRYTGGLATVSELLDAQAVQVQASLGLSQARYALIAAGTGLRQALGRDPGTLATLDTPPVVGASAEPARQF